MDTSSRFLCSLFTGLFLLTSLTLTALPAFAGEGFSLQDSPGQHLDIHLDGVLVARYMYAHDRSTPERLHETYKPYLHVSDADASRTITKGPGGLYTHHRGIFIGWNRIQAGEKTHDRWHMKEGEIVHRTFKRTEAGRREATVTSETVWNDDADKPLLVEERTMIFRRAPSPARMIIDFSSTLRAFGQDLKLDGDPEHAGVQYRPADEVVKGETTYVFPREDADPKKDLDYPWVGETYTLDGKRHSVVHLNHPANPKQTIYSAYRDYGRFGAFFRAPVRVGQPLTIRYGFVVADGEMPPDRKSVV